eukprot:TRINITY_DN4718_c0_g1_i2.p1 TRINITY_DN4718_c0_g1~~TRINITY_DN4718_c0_g1_i2.p1  ORF type:complete len:1147 (+),score=193.04 TRINITY_DN4718_c0_g1_i2:144-3443(+)
MESDYATNSVSTTKYTWWNLIFKNLWEQFRRLANMYFLLVVVIQLIPGLSPLSPVASITPLLFVLGTTMLKDGYEDYQRLKADNVVNKTKTLVLENKKWVEILWEDVRVGDILHIKDDESFPADLVPLSSSNKGGAVYMETANLDGETGHKLRLSIPWGNLTSSALYEPKELAVLSGSIKCPPPNINLDSFDASYQNGRTTIPLSEQNLLLRGATLKGTDWINAVVVFTGADTKLVLNQQDAPSKFSHVERQLNRYIFAVLVLQLLLCVISAMFSLFWETQWGVFMPYLKIAPNARWSIGTAMYNFISMVGSYFILYSNFIPISLYVSMEFVKLISAVVFSQDPDLYWAPTQSGLVVRTSNLLEELGQVNHIFSDKTGTLTENVMKFRKCTVGGIKYNAVTDEDQTDPYYPLEDKEERLTEDVAQERQEVADFLLSIALNHSIEVKLRPNGEKEFNASSPDEEALVLHSSHFGYKLDDRTQNKVVLNVHGKLDTYEILNVIHFTSSRKRMSVIVRTPDNKVVLFCKGADDVIFARMRSKYDLKIFDTTRSHVNLYAEKGLRTLCYAKTVLDTKEYEEWAEEYAVAQSSTHGRDQLTAELAEKVEQNLILLGATAIEDRLQVNVPETLRDLLRADIKLWILTGDKQETAISIGRSCNVITDDMRVVKINTKSRRGAKRILDKQLELIEYNKQQRLAVVIDGSSMTYALSLPGNPFLKLALHATTVICCRVSPMQKAQVVRMVKKDDPYNVTLSIGDGANDVSMIQEADVGIGIRGREGSQASRSADFSFAKFYFLKRLLLVHGRFAVVRISVLIQYSFYKNIAFTLVQFFYAFYNGFSGQTLFDSWVITVFNMVFTALPVIIFAVLEKDVPDIFLLTYPELYNRSRNGDDFNLITFSLWCINAVWHSLVFFFGTIMVWGPGVLSSNGQVNGLWSMGLVASTACVITVNLRLAIETTYWTWLMFIFTFGSILAYFLFLYVYQYITFLEEINLYCGWSPVASSPQFWFQVMVIVAFSILPDFGVKWLQQHIAPKDWQLLLEKRLVAGEDETLNLILTKGEDEEDDEELDSARKETTGLLWEDEFKDTDTSTSSSDTDNALAV